MRFKRKPKNIHPLDQVAVPLERSATPDRVRDLLSGGCLIVGRAGSGDRLIVVGY